MRDTPAVRFDDLPGSNFNVLVERGAVANDRIDVLPPVRDVQEFLSEYPECWLFGWVQRPEQDGDIDVFITGIRLESDWPPRDVERDDVRDDAFLTLKTRLFESFCDAFHIEMTPEHVCVDYCWAPSDVDG